MSLTILGLDGKRYPARQLATEQREYLIGRAHYLAHHDGLSVRGIKAQIERETGLARSVGTIASYLKRPCIMCVQVAQNWAPEHPAEAEA